MIWALFKLRKGYKKKGSMDNTNIIIQEKEQIIIGISVKIEDVIHNEHYIRLYYPTNQRLRNKGDLTLIHPSYCQYFSRL